MSMFSPWTFCIAPMMEWTDRHCRVFHRTMTRHARLYTEMVTTGAIIHGKRERLLGFSPSEQPVALQLGGSDPAELSECANIGEAFGYVEINLNIGCPSDRVQNGRFGACLMAEPELVARCVQAMKKAVRLAVTVKCRIGIDDQDAEASLDDFASRVIDAGADALIVHARKAWLKGLSPRDNRNLPPLNYERIYRLKEKFSAMPIILNGGVATIEAAKEHLQHVDGVMMGRAAYHEPWRLLAADPVLFGMPPPYNNEYDVAQAMEPYLQARLAEGVRLNSLTRHMLTLFHAVPGARAFRRTLAEGAVKEGAGIEVWRKALSMLKGRDVQIESLVA
jgi:tRNA-dihydrouridine synthase A